MSLQDNFNRKIKYLRMSVTDRCDLRCSYCMAEEMQFLPRSEILTLEENLLIARVFVSLGVDKIRLTGGEPLVRKNVPWLARQLRALDGLRELALTTNGTQLPRLSQALAAAGVDRINLSLDSLDAETYSRLTRTGRLSQALAGLEAALASWGPRRVKLNTVLLREVHAEALPELVRFAVARNVDISFIEQMPLGETAVRHAETYLGADEALARLKPEFGLIPSVESSGGPARYWRIPGHESRIGFIAPHSENFCADCNRMRVTARGELYPCLGDDTMVDLMPAARAGDESAVRELILQAAAVKPQAHTFDLSLPQPAVIRFMSHTGG